MTEHARHRVLFVCMGNICRSPLAEGLFLHKINRQGVADRFAVDSCGTGGWHEGARPDHRMLQVASERGVTLPSKARQVHREDFIRFDRIICMDEENRDDLLQRGAPPEKLSLLLEFDPSAPVREVPDPYYGGPEGFGLVFDLVDSATEALLATLLDEMS